jgi:hypothetical protein
VAGQRPQRTTYRRDQVRRTRGERCSGASGIAVADVDDERDHGTRSADDEVKYMSPEPLEVAVRELRIDAAKWDDAGSTMYNAKQVVDEEKALATAFGFLGRGQGTDTAFTLVAEVMSNLADQAEKEFRYGASSLRTVASVYEGAEQESAAVIKKVWHL